MKNISNSRSLWVWRLFAIGYSLLSIFILLGNIFILEPELSPQISGVFYNWIFIFSIILLALVLVFPQYLYFYAIDCCFQALVGIVTGGSIIGILLYLLGCMFAFRQGFFRTHRSLKIAVLFCVFIVAVLSQYRFGLILFMKTFLDLVVVIFVAGAALFLFSSQLNNLMLKPKTGTLALKAAEFTVKDAEMLRRIIAGQKYETIAQDMGMADITFKKHIRTVFARLGVDDRLAFLARYSNYTVTHENEE
jgi:DNA-binding CsgD family transcriptional regulator